MARMVRPYEQRRLACTEGVELEKEKVSGGLVGRVAAFPE